MKKSLIKKIAFSILGVFVLFSGILVYHIYTASQKQNDFRTSRQLGRIDFTEKIDSAAATQLRYYVAGMDGVESTFYNYTNHILVYTYNPEKQTSTSIYNAVVTHGNFPAKKYEVSAEDLTKGCPAMSQNSFSHKATALVAQLLK